MAGGAYGQRRWISERPDAWGITGPEPDWYALFATYNYFGIARGCRHAFDLTVSRNDQFNVYNNLHNSGLAMLYVNQVEEERRNVVCTPGGKVKSIGPLE